jgi:hypothetical protein
MEKLQKYDEVMRERAQFLDNHNQLLQSLLISRHNAGNNTPTQDTPGIGNESVEPG